MGDRLQQGPNRFIPIENVRSNRDKPPGFCGCAVGWAYVSAFANREGPQLKGEARGVRRGPS